jgi:uncharacterized protein (DUF2249 family)
MNTTTILVDVRDDIRNGREPFSKIMSAASNLRADQNLLLIAPFEPVPLVHILNKQGFQHTAHANTTGDWEVLFTRRSAAQPEATAPTGNLEQRKQAAPLATQALEVDSRGLEPPLPMIKILETLAKVPADTELRARTDRRPIHLYAQLEERGFSAQTEEQTDGSFLTHIRRS